MAVSSEVPLGLVSRHIDSNDALAKIKVPILIVEGERQEVSLSQRRARPARRKHGAV
jgi:hypothetical protein